MIKTILCIEPKSNYKLIPGLDLWDKERNAYNYKGNDPVITHAPCQQWSRLRHFANPNPEEKELAMHCLKIVQKNGGIFEHPHGSAFFKYAGIKPTLSVNQHWWNFPAQKTTWLYYSQVEPLPLPLNFNAIQTKVEHMSHKSRSRQTIEFCQWLINHSTNNHL